MKSVFILQHCYEHDDGHNEIKFIGAYSTEKKAREVIERLKTVVGFCDYPVDCFCVDEYEIDKDHWTEGFFQYYYTA